MSVIKIRCPNLSDLAKVLGPIDGADLKKPPKPLCENIFDVQRGELFEVLEMLRKSFWNDDVVEETQSLQQPQFVSSTEEPPLSPTKRIRESDDDMSENESRPMVSKKRARLTNTPQALPPPNVEIKPKQSVPPFVRSLTAYKSLWSAKQSYIRQIKNVNGRDLDVIAELKHFYQSRSKDQCRHMSLYLMPVAQAMRRKRIVESLQKWI